MHNTMTLTQIKRNRAYNVTVIGEISYTNFYIFITHIHT